MATDDNAPKTYLGLDDDALQQNSKNLQTILANTLYIQSLYKKYHWHVTGASFYPYHLLFDKHAGEQTDIIDGVGERLRAIGVTAPGMPEDVVKLTTLSEAKPAEHDPQAMVQNLLEAHEAYIKVVREAIKVTDENNDEATNDLLVSDILRVHELQVWFIRSSLA